MSKFENVKRGTNIVLTRQGQSLLKGMPVLKNRRATFEGISSDIIRVKLEGNQESENYSEDFWKVAPAEADPGEA